LEAVGIRDVLSKSLGSKNPANVVKATLQGLKQLRLQEQIYQSRGLQVKPREKPVAAPASPVATAPAATPAPSPTPVVPPAPPIAPTPEPPPPTV
jgi:hypothetical protein